MGTQNVAIVAKESGRKVAGQPVFPRPVRLIRELIAAFVWLLVVGQLLLFDIASYLSVRFAYLELLLRFRLLTLLVVVALLWGLLGNRRFLLFCGYIFAYPFVLVCWHIPRILFKNWAVVLAFSPAVHSILGRFKASFITFVVVLLAASLASLATYKPLIAGSMSVLGVYLIHHFIRRFRVAFSPSTVFADAANVIRNIWSTIKDSEFFKRPENIAPDSSEYRQKLGQNLLSLYVLTAGLHFLGERLKVVARSRKLDLYFLSSLLYTFILTTVLFAFVYFGLERLLPGSFTGESSPGLFDFLGLSFGTLMTADISPLKPVSGIAQAFMYVQLFASLLIIVLLVFVVLTSIRERHRQDLDAVIVEISEACDRIGSALESNYELTIAGVEALLLEFSPSVMKWCLKLRHGEERARTIQAEREARGKLGREGGRE
ncbi:hypothetical protein [Aromatoleum anaerobium]|uniref:Potassium channel domain-containing protein n=1 Tax=Aromatoleum anaerobium TaxID=182180 RepID=A0ABX1PQW5_9RHOO|nr:hypothetical protein [Aromatoleum anaerobium]MCK0508661.1 hypothetical protein [Aromatoleum anaerobium]